MSEQYFREKVDSSENLVRNDQDIFKPTVYSDLFADKAPVEEAIITETPVSETLATVTPVEEIVVQLASQSEMVSHEAPISTNSGSPSALLNREESEHFRTRWNEIQGKFVDEPRSAVQEADTLVSEVIMQITQMFTSEHSLLEVQWRQGNDVSTEDLRKALQHYRSFFNRLVV